MSSAGAWRIRPQLFGDARGSFAEWFRTDTIERETGFAFSVAQANISTSSRGVVRGIHYADIPPGQAKFVMAVTGSIVDYVVDIRVGSPTFGQWVAEELRADRRDATLIEPGLGHAFVALEDNTTVSYLVTDFYRPDREHGVHPLDADVALALPDGITPILSDKDLAAPTLADALAAGALPKWTDR